MIEEAMVFVLFSHHFTPLVVAIELVGFYIRQPSVAAVTDYFSLFTMVASSEIMALVTDYSA